ncbi:FMN-binding negative transcriptional regulator [Pollutimonas harenae]|uniref:FMN-binding negative transcriptional regulator n=1 Tax=Pollutimonas harenae TaxID=657015 RepID=A0A853GQZ2_9BURK|nr:FMN-binding negative transcriptional regulator [Pollutimonas harenae]NYT84577.1 FMN-binding negative transcriptional regulator [Pollutimonas harenae]TEA73031.1 FMN-binding negative transcriptional regulator [Pollutimonas harenae]
MYIPDHFKEPSTQVLHGFIDQNPFGILFTNGAGGYDANHLPFELQPEQGPQGTLLAHVARNNPVWQDVQTGDKVLVVFQGAHAYVSPTWYPSKQEHHKQVPTWNYMVAHAHGRITIRDDERYVRGVVARLTRRHEANLPQPWKMTDGPKEYIDSMLKAIVGIEIEITSLVGKFKLSQNKAPQDIHGAGIALKEQGHTVLGDAMLAAPAKG